MAEWSNAVASAAAVERSRVRFPGLRSRSEPRRAYLGSQPEVDCGRRAPSAAAGVFGISEPNSGRFKHRSGCIHDSKCPISGSDSGRPGPIPDGFGTHSRFKMPDLGVGFGTSRIHPGWVRDTFTVQNVRFRGRIRDVFVVLKSRKSVIIIVNMVLECCFFVIFQDRHFKLDFKMTIFCRVYSA